MSDLVDRVQLGVFFLDDTQPGWRDKIDILELDVNSFGSCVLGQLYRGRGISWRSDGDYDRGLWELHDWLAGQNLANLDFAPVRAGFDGEIGDDMKKLTAVWAEAIGR